MKEKTPLDYPVMKLMMVMMTLTEALKIKVPGPTQ